MAAGFDHTRRWRRPPDPHRRLPEIRRTQVSVDIPDPPIDPATGRPAPWERGPGLLPSAVHRVKTTKAPSRTGRGAAGRKHPDRVIRVFECGVRSPVGAYLGEDRIGRTVARYVVDSDDDAMLTCDGCRMKVRELRDLAAGGYCLDCRADLRNGQPHGYWCGSSPAAERLWDPAKTRRPDEDVSGV